MSGPATGSTSMGADPRPPLLEGGEPTGVGLREVLDATAYPVPASYWFSPVDRRSTRSGCTRQGGMLIAASALLRLTSIGLHRIPRIQ
jgi:hypothetical protein